MAHGNLSACLPVTLRYEGGFSLRRDDPGNWTGGRVGAGTLKGTNFGIAASAHPTLDIVHLTRAEAEAIYASEYWTPAGCEALPAGLDLSHFDGTVNSGRARSARWLARASSKTSGGTVAARIQAYNSARLSFDQALSSWARFGKAWGARVASVEAKSLRMALGQGAAATAIIATRAAGHARKASVHATSAHAATATAAGGAALSAGHHPVVATGVGLLSILSALALAFAGWRNGVRAAALSHEAANDGA